MQRNVLSMPSLLNLEGILVLLVVRVTPLIFKSQCDPNYGAHFDAVWIFPQKCAPSVGRNRPMTRSLKKTQKVKANAQGYSHLPTHLMVSIDRYENYISKKVSLGTQIFILCQIWQLEKQFYEKVNKFWLVSYEIEAAATYEKSHSEASRFTETRNRLPLATDPAGS